MSAPITSLDAKPPSFRSLEHLRLGHKDRVWIAVLILIGGGLRFGAINVESFWEDELAQLRIATSPITEIPARARAHQQPALDYLVEAFAVRILGTPHAARVPAALFGTLSPLVFFLVFRRLSSRRVAVAASLILVLSYAHLHYSREARPYAHLLFWTGIFWLAMLRAWRINSAASWALVSGTGLICLHVRGLDPVILLTASALVATGLAVWMIWQARSLPPALWRSRPARCVLACAVSLAAFYPTAHAILYHPRSLNYHWPIHGRPTWADEPIWFFLASMIRAAAQLLPPSMWALVAFGLLWTAIRLHRAARRTRSSSDHPPVPAGPIAYFLAVNITAAILYPAAYYLLNGGIQNPPKTGYFLFLLPGAALPAAIAARFLVRRVAMMFPQSSFAPALARMGAAGLVIAILAPDSLAARHYLTKSMRPDWSAIFARIDREASDGDLVIRETDHPFGTYEYHPNPGRGVLHDKDLTVTSVASLPDELANRSGWRGRIFLIYSSDLGDAANLLPPDGARHARFRGADLIYYHPPRGFESELDGLTTWLIRRRPPTDPALADLHLVRSLLARRRGRESLSRFRVALAAAVVPPKNREFFDYVCRRIHANDPVPLPPRGAHSPGH